MAKFTFTRDWSGYSRGVDTLEVTANSIEEAREKLYGLEDDLIREVVRDDLEKGDWDLVEDFKEDQHFDIVTVSDTLNTLEGWNSLGRKIIKGSTSAIRDYFTGKPLFSINQTKNH